MIRIELLNMIIRAKNLRMIFSPWLGVSDRREPADRGRSPVNTTSMSGCRIGYNTLSRMWLGTIGGPDTPNAVASVRIT